MNHQITTYPPEGHHPDGAAFTATPAAPEQVLQPSKHATRLAEYLSNKSVNKAVVSRKTGLSKQRMGELTLNKDAQLRVRELYLIALAIGVNPCELFEYVCSGLALQEDSWRRA